MKFKFGDRVKIVKDKDDFYTDVEGTIVHYDDVEGTFTVLMPNNVVKDFYEERLKKIKGVKNVVQS